MYKLLSIPLLVLTLLVPPQENVPTPAPELPPVTTRPVDATPFDYTIVHTVFLEAKTAKIYQLEDKVRIQVEDLSPVRKQGVVLTLQGVVEKQIEVTTLVNFNGLTVGLYPPQFISPNTDGTYVILGEPGDKFGVRARTATGIEQIFVEIKGTKPDLPPPTGSIDGVTKVVKLSVTTLNDPVTQAAVKAQIDLLLNNFPDDLEAAKQALKTAIADGLLISMQDLPPPYKDWKNGFRVPLDNEIEKLQVTNASQFREIVIAISKGM